jgi:proton-dependent oligopeptide transporter, POT family
MRTRVTATLSGRELLGHPVGLFVLFFTEMWERFSYYGMRALLVLYMTRHLLVDPQRAGRVFGYDGLEALLTWIFGAMSVQQISSQIYGLYTGLVYLTPIFGGMLADRVLGRYRTVYLGGLLMATGQFLLMSERLFLPGLLFLIVGNGCFKPNISTQVGELYREGDPRRDGAFTIFYMGINLGAMFSPLVCGTLGQKVGWHWGFGSAGVGMLCGLFVYWLGSGLVPKPARRPAESTGAPVAPATPMTRKEWLAVVALVFLCALNIPFWAAYEQQGNTMQLWADERIDWEFFGFTVPSTWYQSFGAGMILFLAPALDAFWKWRARRHGRTASSISKMGLGSVYLGAGYAIMIAAALLVPEGVRGSLLWLVGVTFVITIGELYLSPIGLSFVTKVAPRTIISTMMGVWFLSSFAGNYLTGYLGTFYETMPNERFFLILALLGLVTGAVFLLAKRPIEKAIGRQA